MFEDFYETLSNEINDGIDDFLNNAGDIDMAMTNKNKYEMCKGQELGSGTYGVVLKAKHRDTGSYFALKKLKLDKEKDGVLLFTYDISL